jgi:uncharacterized protein
MSAFAREVVLPVSPQEAFRWHQRKGAFERLTPPWEAVEVVEPAEVKDGARARLRMHLGPVHKDWVAEHKDVVFGEGFKDVQVSGPFAAWEHEHRFEPDGEGGASRLCDSIEYRLPLGGLGLAGGMVERRLERMFRYRHDITRGDLKAHKELSTKPLRLGVTGASGLIGAALLPYLSTGGHEPRGLARQPSADALGGLDAVVHLAGEPLTGRWTAAKKRRIFESRVDATRKLSLTLAALPTPPRVLVTASGIGFYGDRGAELLDESASPGEGFLAEVCQGWEDATRPAREAGIRVVHVRTGVVLSQKGGALPKLALPYRFGLGGRLGREDAYFSFLSLDDQLDVLLRCLVDERLEGPVNACTPSPVTHRELARALGRVLRRPAALPVPAFALKAALGSEVAEEMLLVSQRVMPKKLLDAGHTFRTPTLEETLRHVLGRSA